MIHPEGIEIKGLYDPVWVTGIVQADASEQEVRYVDGQTEVAVSYAMQPESVVPC